MARPEIIHRLQGVWHDWCADRSNPDLRARFERLLDEAVSAYAAAGATRETMLAVLRREGVCVADDCNDINISFKLNGMMQGQLAIASQGRAYRVGINK